MIPMARNLSFVILVTALYASAEGTVSGTVKDPAGAPFKHAFVRAQNTKTRITTIVLSDAQGRYRAQNLPPGEYFVRATAVGYNDDSRESVQIAAGKPVSLDFTLQKGTVRWSDLTTYQGRQLLPKTDKHDLSHKDVFFTSCFQSCHSFQKTMAPFNWDKNGWATRVRYMRDVIMGAEDSRLNDERVDDFASYMTAAFGPNSKPASPADLPEYKNLVRTFSDAASKIAFVEYEFRGTKGLGPWSAVEDQDGMVWIPYHNRGNEVVRLHPETGELKRFALPFTETAGIHSAIPTSDGSVWFTEADMGRIGRLNPRTGEITEYQNTLPNGRRAGSHTVRVGDRGFVWTSGGPMISRFDPETKKFQHFDVGGTYGNEMGHNGDQWFTVFRETNGAIVRISRDGTVSRFAPPTEGKPQRLQIDKEGIVWFSERRGGKIGRFDPKTETFKEYQLPGPEPSPYALGLDRNGMIWYASHEQDTLGRLNPRTGEITEYPFPHSEISIREFFMDSKGRIWYGSTANDLVGYFIPPVD
jgi:virginiamycin B lyase